MIAAQPILAFLWKCRKYWWVLLIVVIAAQAKQNNMLREENAKLTGEGNIELKDDEGGRVIIGPDGTRSAVRDENGGVKNENVYVPREGSTDVTVKMDPAVKAKLNALNEKLAAAKANGETSQEEIDRLNKERDELQRRLMKVNVDVKTWGFTIRPGIGVLYSKELYPEVDIKFFFWKRYSAKVGATTKFFDVGVSRHIDDLMPFRIKFRNLEIQITYGFEYEDMGNRRFAIGGRLNL